MRNPILSLKGMALVAIVTTMGVATASADNWWAPHPKRVPQVPVSNDGLYNVSGRYTGYLSGNIDINGQTFRITNNTQVYELGRGAIEVGQMVTDRFMFMLVSRADGGNSVETVIIRPLTDSTDPDIAPTASPNGPTGPQ